MSLINEALKRARVEAARREAAAKGVPLSALPVYVPRRRRSWLSPLLGFGVGLAVVGVAAGGYWLARGPRPAPQAAAAPQAAIVPPPVAASAPAGGSAPAEAPVVEPPPSPPMPETRAALPHPYPPPVAAPERPPAVPAPAAATPPSEAPPHPAPEVTAPLARVRGLEDGRTYRVEVKPVGSAPVKLDFIVWSASSPFAQINGRQVSPGQSVDGYELLAVERERVQLEGGGVRFWLRAW